MDRLRCVVERITYQNENNGFSVIKCKAKGFSDLVTVTGSMPEVHVGSVLNLTGEWRLDPKYGRQFVMNTFEETLPATVYGIEKYLGSGLVKGIGPEFAKRIVKKFGADTLNVIEDDPDKLIQVAGIGKLRVERIKKSWVEQKEVKNIMLFLQSHNVSTSHATKIYKTYGNDSISVVQENPYKLADDIWGIGFKTADMIAEKLGFDHDRYERLRSGLEYTLNQLSTEGHCYATREMLIKAGCELLTVEKSLLSEALDRMISENVVKTDTVTVTDGKKTSSYVAIYLPPFYFSEIGVARRICEIGRPGNSMRIDIPDLERKISSLTGMEYDEVQMQAIQTAVQNKVMILTGGPGTGKTTTTLGIIKAFQLVHANILLAAPTGRAAKRMSETTGMEAKTIHRLLEFSPLEGYKRNEDEPLDGDVLIVDECSMIDIMLMYNLLKAVPDKMTVIFVGDIDQLPSVGAGNVLRDIISSDCFPVVRLTRIFRQAQDSRIIMNAHKINKGKMPDISNGKDTDFFFIERDEPEAAAEEIVGLVCRRLPKHYGLDSRDIQVLTPMHRGVVGAAKLNEMLQKAVNPNTESITRNGCCYRLQDKVMQIRNNYDKDVFNGDIGTIVNINMEDRELIVNFDDRQVAYDATDLDELVLAYATSIHKSQGSEYPIVIIPILMTHYVMLQRNLIYTGVTRAKKVLIIVGSKKALAMAVRNMNVQKRNTMLTDRIKQQFVGVIS